jgi:hypothetical protein
MSKRDSGLEGTSLPAHPCEAWCLRYQESARVFSCTLRGCSLPLWQLPLGLQVSVPLAFGHQSLHPLIDIRLVLDDQRSYPGGLCGSGGFEIRAVDLARTQDFF